MNILPRTLELHYLKNSNPFKISQVPSRLHIRGCKTVEQSGLKLLLSSEFDALNDIVFELHLLHEDDSVAIVDSVFLKEQE